MRNPAKAEDLAQKRIRVSQADFTDPPSMRAAFDQAELVLIVSSTGLGRDGFQHHANAIQAAKDAGVKRILYTGHQHALAPPSCGVPYVVLQNGFYAESTLFQLEGMRRTGTIALPQDGMVNWTARADLAEAGVAVLLYRGLINDGKSAPLTGTDLVGFNGIAAILSELTGSVVRRDVVSDEDYKRTLRKNDIAEGITDLLLSLYLASRAGEFPELDPTLQRLIGKESLKLRQILSA